MPSARDVYQQGFKSFVAGELDEAIERYRQAIELDPELPIAWNGLSMALSRKGELAEAIGAARRLVELKPDDALSHTNLSRLLQQQGRIPEAEAAMAEAMRLQMQAK